MHAQKQLRTLRVLREAKNICIANLAIRFNQVTAETIQPWAAKRIHDNTPVEFYAKENGRNENVVPAGPVKFTRPVNHQCQRPKD